MNSPTPLLLIPEWPAPAKIRACTTLRGGQSDFDLLNPTNRKQLQSLAGLPSEPIWLKQIHGDTVVKALPQSALIEADASYTDEQGVVCAILTADCLPVLLCHQDGTKIAAVHAGWRSLVAGIIPKTLSLGGFSAKNTLVWLGPAISPAHFEVGEEVRTAFLRQWPGCSYAFIPSRPGHWMADLYALAIKQLNDHGVYQITHSNRCTFSERNDFFSWRRNKDSGRMATLIWMI